MTLTIYASAFNTSPTKAATLLFTFNPPDQKATIYIGPPKDRRCEVEDTSKQWSVTVPDSACVEGGMLKWTAGGRPRWLTADQVYAFAQQRVNGFGFAD